MTAATIVSNQQMSARQCIDDVWCIENRPIAYARQIAAQILQAKIEILDTSHADTIRGRGTIGLVLEFLRGEGLED